MAAHCGGSVEYVEQGAAVEFHCGEGGLNTAAARIELGPAKGTRG